MFLCLVPVPWTLVSPAAVGLTETLLRVVFALLSCWVLVCSL